MRGDNHVFREGASAGGPVEIESALVKTGNLDHYLFHPQTDFFGKISGNYGVAVVLVGGLEQAVNYLKVEAAGGSDLLTHIVRVDDANPHSPTLTLEDVDGAKITTVRDLGELDASGVDRHVIGLIDTSELIDLSETEEPPPGDDDDSAAPPPLPAGAGDDDDSASGDDDDTAESAEATITDTDRYAFTLAGPMEVGIWLDRRVSSVSGDASLADPFLAVVPSTDVPDAFDYSQWGFGPLPVHGPCSDVSYFNYPLVMPGWVAAQGNLMSVAGEGEVPSGGPWQSWVQGQDVYDCEYDHDQDGIRDVNEEEPDSLMAQILLRQAENLILDPSFYDSTFGTLPGFGPVDAPWWNIDFFDIDSGELAEDEFATAILPLNIGGRSVEGGEEAVWYGTLPPGGYTVIVGDGTSSSGPYDLTLRVLGN